MSSRRLKQWGLVLAAVVTSLFTNGAAALVIGANYGAGWGLDAKNAFYFAENIVASRLPTFYAGETIVIDASWRAMTKADGTPDTNTLGGASLSFPFQWWANFGSADPDYRPSTWYSSALANHLHGSDISPAAEMTIEFNSNYANWYFGMDGIVPADKIDFVSVAIHEIVHGLGFYNLVEGDGLYRFYGSLGNPYETPLPSIFDAFVAGDRGDGTINSLVNMTVAERTFAVTSGDLFWEGAWGQAANGGQPVELYSPAAFSLPSSVSHLDPVAFPNTLMSPTLARGVRNHSIPGVELGMLYDIGWIPEPGSLLLLALALFLLVASRHKGRHAWTFGG